MRFGISIHPYSAALIFSALASLLLGVRAWYGTRKALSRSFAFFEVTVFVWSALRLAEWESSTALGQFAALKLQFIGMAFVPAAYFMLAKAASGRALKTRASILLLLPGLAALAIIATNDLHGLFWVGDLLAAMPSNPRAGIVFWIFVAYSYAQVVAGFYLLIRAAASSRGEIARALRRLLWLSSLPFAANVAFTLFFIGRTGYDPTPVAIAAASIVFAIGNIRFDILESVPFGKGAVLESIDSPLVVVDPEGMIVGANEVARRIAPSVEWLEGRYVSDLVPVLKGDETDGETREWSEGGIVYRITCHGVKRGPNLWGGRIYLFRDITALVLAKREAEDAWRKADAANSTKNAFFATVSHEMRNPLNAIIGLVDLNLRAGPPPELRDDLEVMLASGNVLLGMINDLLDLSKIEAGKMELERVDFDLHEKAVSVLRAFRPIAGKKGLFLDIIIEPGTPRIVRGDPLRYSQVVMNLVSNAVKFTEHGSVIVELSPGPAACAEGEPRSLTVMTSVRDSGIGIAQDKLPLLFREFSQADPSVSRRFGGTGLGLSISKKLVALFGGEISVASVDGQGSDFSFTARFEEGEAQGTGLLPEERALAEGARLRVLIVDDDPINAAVARRYIQRLGYTSQDARTGSEAISLVGSRDLDFVLLDLGLPDMDGFEACRRIRQVAGARHGAELPIAAMTARADSGLRAACASAGMIDCLAKPLDPPTLARLLARVAASAREFGPRAASSVREPRIAVAQSALAPEPSRPGSPLFDIPALLIRLDDDSAFMRELLEIFIDEAPVRLAAFEGAAKGLDVARLQKLSHALKGSALSLCAAPLSAAAGALEAACLSIGAEAVPGLEAFDPIAALLDELVAALERAASAAAEIVESAP